MVVGKVGDWNQQVWVTESQSPIGQKKERKKERKKETIVSFFVMFYI